MHFTSASSRNDTRFTTLTLLLASVANVELVDDGERIEVGEELVLEEECVVMAVVGVMERVRRGRRGEGQADSREEDEEEEGLRGIIRERRGREGTVVVVFGLSIFFLFGKGDFGVVCGAQFAPNYTGSDFETRTNSWARQLLD